MEIIKEESNFLRYPLMDELNNDAPNVGPASEQVLAVAFIAKCIGAHVIVEHSNMTQRIHERWSKDLTTLGAGSCLGVHPSDEGVPIR